MSKEQELERTCRENGLELRWEIFYPKQPDYCLTIFEPFGNGDATLVLYAEDNTKLKVIDMALNRLKVEYGRRGNEASPRTYRKNIQY